MSDWDEDAPDWADEEGESITATCPECGAEVYEDVEQCPACGMWIVPSTSPMTGRPTWFVLLGLLGIIAVVLVLSGLAGFL